MNPRTVSALTLRYLFLYVRTPLRIIELIFWPIVDLLIWGYLTFYIAQNSSNDFGQNITRSLLGGVILWDVIFRAQQGVAISFMEDVWTRNLLNVFVAPVRTSEYVMATFLVGLVRISITVVILSLLSYFIYAFNIFWLSWGMIPFFANLLISGWALGMISTALILRWGPAAESLAWAVPFFIQPFTAAYYPVSTMKPVWVQALCGALPSTHVFEGMRQMLDLSHPFFSWSEFFLASGLNVILMAVAASVFGWTLKMARQRALLTKFATQ